MSKTIQNEQIRGYTALLKARLSKKRFVHSVNVARAYGIPDAGEIKEGALADCLLVRLDNERMVPAHDVVSNWVYAADSGCIDSVICNGRFLMRHRHVDGEEDILNEAQACAKRLAGR